MKIKKNDNVIVLTGKDKGKTGKVVKAMPKENMVIVEGVNMRKKHQRPRKQGQKGQVVEIASPINASNVTLKDEASKAKPAKKAKAAKKETK